MLQAFYTGLSGMFSFSDNLSTVSNNIANMNTPGFRGGENFYKSLSFSEGSYGTQIDSLGYRFTAGDIRQTGNATDLAISGNGFFTLLKDDQQFYSRAGQFVFNDQGELVDRTSGAAVAALDSNGQLQKLDISGLKVLPPKATTSVSLSGNLSSEMSEHSINGVVVYNGLGEATELKLTFSKSATVAGSWTVTVKDTDDNTLHTAELRFNTDGSPTDGFNAFNFELEDSRGNKTPVAFDFGTGFGKTTSVASGATSTIKAKVDDGYALSDLQQISFTADGALVLKYANGEEKSHLRLAISDFSNKDALELVEGSLFRSKDNASLTLGRAGEGSLGKIAPQSLELSNVDLSKEFADMIIIQRGYQASSRMLNVANQMLEQLYENTRGR
ncbi:flagellar basal-body rod protein FlgF [Arsukibacterium perlucidum]|uniref:flagellar basal-body rod protein FlgF n=1 Tax=Arsukibacterium perlucidum TaxID=368811 RepID=UPI000377C89F|nr:flagellar basal-body rod protein FlgF [Arsukibacterium perlucidum]